MIAHLSTYLGVLRFESWKHFLSIVRLDRLYKAKKNDILDEFLVNLGRLIQIFCCITPRV